MISKIRNIDLVYGCMVPTILTVRGCGAFTPVACTEIPFPFTP